MSILLEEDEMLAIQNEYAEESRAIWGGSLSRDEKTELAFALFNIPQRLAKATGKKILIQLQAIYNIPDLKGSDVRMGEFIQELQEEVK